MWAELLVSAALAAAPVVSALPSGDTLVVVADDTVPLVAVRIDLPAGRLSPWWQRTHAAAAWHLPLTDPTRRDALAAQMSLSLRHDDWRTTLEARFHAEDTDAAVSALAELLAAEGGHPDALRAWRQGTAEAPWMAADRGAQSVLRALAARAVLGDGDPRQSLPTTGRLRRRRVRQAQAHLSRLPGRVIGFAGDITAEEARDAAAQILPAPLPRAPTGLAPSLPDAPAARPASARARAPARARGWVLTARPGLAASDPDLPALWLAMHALSASGRSRMYQTLRHEQGLVYAVDTQLGTGPEPGVLMVVTACRLVNLEPVAAASRAEVDRFAADGLTDAELRAAKAALRQAAAQQAGAPDAALHAAVEQRSGGTNLVALAAAADTLSLGAVNSFVADFFGPGSITVITVLPGGSLE